MSIAEHKELAQAVAAWASVFGIFIGLGGAWIAVRKYIDDSRRALEQARKDYNIRARDYYYKYCELSLMNPEFRNGYLQRADITGDEASKYRRFIMYMLNSIEDIFDTESDERWKDALKTEVRMHSDFFRSRSYAEIADYFYEDTRNWVAKVLAESPRESTDA